MHPACDRKHLERFKRLSERRDEQESPCTSCHHTERAAATTAPRPSPAARRAATLAAKVREAQQSKSCASESCCAMLASRPRGHRCSHVHC